MLEGSEVIRNLADDHLSDSDDETLQYVARVMPYPFTKGTKYEKKIQSNKDNGAEEYECNHTINILTLRYDVQVIPPRNGEETSSLIVTTGCCSSSFSNLATSCCQIRECKKSISKSLSFNQQTANLFFSQTCNLHDLTYWHA